MYIYIIGMVIIILFLQTYEFIKIILLLEKRKLYCYSKKENCIVTQKSETLQVKTLHVDNEF